MNKCGLISHKITSFTIMKEVRKVDAFAHFHARTSITAAAIKMPGNTLHSTFQILLISSEVYYGGSYVNLRRLEKNICVICLQRVRNGILVFAF